MQSAPRDCAGKSGSMHAGGHPIWYQKRKPRRLVGDFTTRYLIIVQTPRSTATAVHARYLDVIQPGGDPPLSASGSLQLPCDILSCFVDIKPARPSGARRAGSTLHLVGPASIHALSLPIYLCTHPQNHPRTHASRREAVTTNSEPFAIPNCRPEPRDSGLLFGTTRRLRGYIWPHVACWSANTWV